MMKHLVRFKSDQSGLGALEFALIAPIMIVMLFAINEGCAAFEAARRANLAGNTLADLVAQEREVTPEMLDDAMVGVRHIIEPDTSTLEVKVLSLIIDPDTDKVVVAWSRDNSGGEPYAPGSAYSKVDQSNFYDASASVIVAETKYIYKSKIAKKMAPEFTFDKINFRWPRRTQTIQLVQ